MNIAEIQFALDKHGYRLIDKLPNGELLVREKTPQENMKHKDGIEEEEFYRAWNAGQVRRVSDGKIMNPQIKDAPPQRPWVDLTDEEMSECNLDADELMISREVAKLNVQAKLKEKNYD